MVTIDGFEIDATLTEDHAFDSDVTSHPVETGADVTDHVRAKPITVTLDCIVSDTPIGPLADRRGDRNSDGSLQNIPSADAFAWLLAIRDRRAPVTIVSSLRQFDNMLLQSLSVPRSADNGDALRFRASFVQVQLVTNERTTVRVAVPRAAKKVNLGNKPIVETAETPKPAKRRVSLLKQGLLDIF